MFFYDYMNFSWFKCILMGKSDKIYQALIVYFSIRELLKNFVIISAVFLVKQLSLSDKKLK